MSDDLIRRSDAIGAVWGDDINPSEDGMVFEAQSHIDRDIRLIPSADRPQGEWKSVKASIYPYGYDVECSACCYRMGSSFGYKFCPMCGCRMKGADDES